MIQQNPSGFFNTNMSNLTSASGEAASASSTNPNPSKKRRNQPGNPDPDAEVIALSPKSLLATNRFFCEICSKGFQRDQNLQLHRRGHNLPWKLKQRSSKDVVRKKVYVCPESSCVHHDPSRALGDLTGIKKHFCRKHGEKKWKCERCSKKYAVQSDWKAHSKTCGTREYRCDCGTLFSRRDSFITHRAFCDALAQESARTITATPLTGHHPLLFSHPAAAPHAITAPHDLTFQTHFPYTGGVDAGHDLHHDFGLKRERQEYSFNIRAPHDLNPPPPQQISLNYLEHHFPSSLFNSRTIEHDMEAPPQATSSALIQNQITSSSSTYHASASPHMSATALLQRAAQMGATMSRPDVDHALELEGGPHHATTSFGLGLPTSQPKSANGSSSFAPPALMHDVMMNSLSSGFDGSPFGDAFGGILGAANRSEDNGGHLGAAARRKEDGGGGAGTDGRLTIDFLGSKAYYHGEILNLAAGMDPRMSSSSSYDQHEHNNKKPWIG